MDYIKAFVIGGLICVLGQILLDKTNITSSRILVLFVVAGCVLGGFGLYEKFVEFAGAGATVPLPGFGNLLAKGTMKEVDEMGLLGVLSGGFKSMAGGVSAAILFSFVAGVVFSPKEK
ncbi:MAG: stage V sporulation protein AE [Clostridiales bacterium]|jgi:stage V sporulation protein AE|nr:stage V sporulation protein AE [Clostridiales bacterium]